MKNPSPVKVFVSTIGSTLRSDSNFRPTILALNRSELKTFSPQRVQTSVCDSTGEKERERETEERETERVRETGERERERESS